MYVAAHHVVDAKGAKAGINVYLHQHAPTFAWPVDVRKRALIPDESPGALKAQHLDLPPGGNRVQAYLDAIAPETTPPGEVLSTLRLFAMELGEHPNPTVVEHGAVLVRFGVAPSLEARRDAELRELIGGIERLLTGWGAVQRKQTAAGGSMKNQRVWEHAQATEMLVMVEVNRRQLLGAVLGRGTSVVTDEAGRTQRTWQLLLTHGHTVVEVAETARILAYGPSTWRNIAAWHFGEAVYEHVGRSSETPTSSYFRDHVRLLLLCEEQSIGLHLPEIEKETRKLVAWFSPAFIDGIRRTFRERLHPSTSDERRYGGELLAHLLGGDARTYAETWDMPLPNEGDDSFPM